MKLKFYKEEIYPLHICGKSAGESWPLFEEGFAWQRFSEVIQDIQEDYGVKTHSFVLMNNHYHWLMSYDFDSDPAIIEWFHESVDMSYLHTLQTCIGGLFSTDIGIVRINNIKQFQATYKYIYCNPMVAGLTDKVQNYPFSSLRGVLGLDELDFLCEDNMHLIHDPQKVLSWLNGSESLEKPLFLTQ